MQLSAKTRPKGFALLITVTLLAFLVLLLVSLASLTRVETQVASNNQQLAQARQNALMALNIAIGELQKYTGPDQRTTARSDVLNTVPPAAVYTAPSSRWVGAYGSAVAADYTLSPSVIANNISTSSDARGNQARLLNWLVSGNESTAFNPATNVGPNGNITSPASSPAFTPADTVSGITLSSVATDTNIKIKGTQDARLLVGANTVGASLIDFVAAPLKSIDTVVAGFGSSPVSIGRYAWWVGDEGMKARINLPMADSTQTANAFVSSHRAAIELMDTKVSASTTLAAVNMLGNKAPSYNPNDPALSPNLPKLVTPSQVSLLPTLNAADSTTFQSVIKYRYHDLTLNSNSVLSDTYAGGLKKDLSAVLSTGTTSPLDKDFIFTPQANVAPDLANENGLPTWGQLRDFVRTTASPSGLLPRLPQWVPSTNPSAGNNPVISNVTISPVMTYGTVGFEVIAPNGNIQNEPIQMAVLPVVVLWNPYTVPIRGIDDSGNPVRYEFGIRKIFADQIELQGHDDLGSGGNAAYVWSSANVLAKINMGTPISGDPHFRFIIESPSTGIPPGQSLVFTLKNPSGDLYTGSNVLVNSYNTLRYVLMPKSYTENAKVGVKSGPAGGINTPSLPGGIYRLAASGAAYPAPPDPPTTVKTRFLGDTVGSMGGAGLGSQEGYLGVAPSSKPGDSNPVGSSFSNRGIYQSFLNIGGPFANTAPYGSGATGYATSSGATGLVQPERTLNTVVAAPAFRMMIHALFLQTPTTLKRTRWIVNNNVRALLTGGSATFSGQPSNSSWPPNLQCADGIHVSSCVGLEDTSDPAASATLFEFRPDTMPLLSIGQLQHANLGWSGGIPAYAIGNSNSGLTQQQPPATQNTLPAFPIPDKLVRLSSPNNSVAYDISYLLNMSLWDRYFVSTVPNKGTGTAANASITPTTSVPEVLPNPRHVRHNIDPDASSATTAALLRDPDKAAAHLLLSGGFNINSTSEQAWRAILAGSNQLNYDPTGANIGGTAWSKTVYSRFSKPTTNSTLTSGTPNAAWLGYRRLTDVQISQLAANIVAEIRHRGPFVSLGDFINRRLVASGAFYPSPLPALPTPAPLPDPRLKGTIQAAIDATTSGISAINDGTLPPFTLSNKITRFFSDNTTTAINPFSSGSRDPDNPVMPYGSTAAFAPQFLTQADVLSNIGSGLSARSDTFTIRTYGEVVNPAVSSGDSGYITARAWCEAVVQRLPAYVNPGLTSTSAGDPDITATAALLNADNKKFGRRFKIISFRWLTSNDI